MGQTTSGLPTHTYQYTSTFADVYLKRGRNPLDEGLLFVIKGGQREDEVRAPHIDVLL